MYMNRNVFLILERTKKGKCVSNFGTDGVVCIVETNGFIVVMLN